MARLPPKYVPHQSRVSVQNIRDYSTPRGMSAANEEFRRLALSINELQDAVSDESKKGGEVVKKLAVVQQQLPDYDPAKGAKSWATTVFHGSTPVGPAKVVQGLTFIDSADPGPATSADFRTFGIDFNMDYVALDKQYANGDGVTNVRLKAKTIVDPHMGWQENILRAHVRWSIEWTGTEVKVIQFRNDVDKPGAKYYYGTNAAGTKGWYPIEAGIDTVARLNLRNIFSELAEAKSFVETWNVAAASMNATDLGYVAHFQNTPGGVPLQFSDVYFRGDMFSTETEGIRTYTVFRAGVPGYYYVSAKYVLKVDDAIDPPGAPLQNYTNISLTLQKKEVSGTTYAFEAFIGHDFDKILYLYNIAVSYVYIRVFQYQIEGGCTVWMEAGDKLRLIQETVRFPAMAPGAVPLQYYVRWDVHYVGEFGHDIVSSRINSWVW